MQRYEFRILRADGRTALIVAGQHLNDQSAICQAQLLAKGQPVEVWRDMDCIYSPQATHTQVPPGYRRTG